MTGGQSISGEMPPAAGDQVPAHDRVSVVLLDDNAAFRHITAQLLRLHYADQISVIGVATVGADGLTLIDGVQPQVVLVGLGMPATKALAFVQQLRFRCQRVVIACLGSFGTASYAEAARSAGADAFVAKEELNTRLRVLVREGRQLHAPGINDERTHGGVKAGGMEVEWKEASARTARYG